MQTAKPHTTQIEGLKEKIGGGGSSLYEGIAFGRRRGEVDHRGGVEALAAAMKEEGVGSGSEGAVVVLMDRSHRAIAVAEEEKPQKKGIADPRKHRLRLRAYRSDGERAEEQ